MRELKKKEVFENLEIKPAGSYETTYYQYQEKEMIRQKGDSTLVPGFAAAEIKTVNYADSLDGKPEPILRSEFEKKEAISRGIESYTFTNAQYIPRFILEKYLNSKIKGKVKGEGDEPSDEYKKMYAAGIDFINGKFSVKLVIRNMGEKLGKGLFMGENVVKKAMISPYACELKPGTEGSILYDWTHALRGESFCALFTQIRVEGSGLNLIPLGKAPYIYSAKRYGNYSSFAQCLPEEKMLPSIGVPAKYQQYVATSNIELYFILFLQHRWSIPFFCASRMIYDREILGFWHGDEYWLNKGDSYSLFNRRGETIGSVTEGKLDQTEIELKRNVVLCELKHHTKAVNYELAANWKFAPAKLIAHLIADRDPLMLLAQAFIAKGINAKVSKIDKSKNPNRKYSGDSTLFLDIKKSEPQLLKLAAPQALKITLTI